MRVPLEPHLTFSVAAEQWFLSRQFGEIRSKARYLAPNTLKSYANYIRALNRFFSELPLNKIHLGHFAEYREMRLETTGPNHIKQEEDVLIGIMKRAGVWNEEMSEVYEPLQYVESNIPKALTPQEQQRWLDTCASQKRWGVVYWYSLIAFRTTASNCEMRGLTIGDINLSQQVLTVQPRHAKNRHRIRTIPLPPDALWAAERLLERVHQLGANSPKHFLFPFWERNGQAYDFTKPMSEWGVRKPWDEARSISGLANFTPHDCRHTAITRYAEAGVPMPVILSLAGHISLKMQAVYTQISEQAKKRAAMAAYSGEFYDPESGKRGHRLQVHDFGTNKVQRFSLTPGGKLSDTVSRNGNERNSTSAKFQSGPGRREDHHKSQQEIGIHDDSGYPLSDPATR